MARLVAQSYGGTTVRFGDQLHWTDIRGGVIYLHASTICNFNNMAAKIRWDPYNQANPATLSQVYNNAINSPPTGANTHAAAWAISKSHLDIDLYDYGTPTGEWVAIAVNLAETTSLEFLHDDSAATYQDGIKNRAITAADNDDVGYLSWVYQDNFLNGKIGGKQQVVVFACKRSALSTAPYLPFNIGVVVTDSAGSDWTTAVIIDPHIKNQG